jgi:hypothetical protein
MSKYVFRHWVESQDSFWKQANASTLFDTSLADPRFQRSISVSRGNQALYSYIESRIARDYAKLVDFKLRYIVSNLSRSDFSDSSVFSNPEKHSRPLRQYFAVRRRLERLLDNDILQHDHAESRLSAFRRWIDVANLLLNQGCYEGFLLVIWKLDHSKMKSKISLDNLSDYHQNLLREMAVIANPKTNFKALRDKIGPKPSVECLYPVHLWRKDLTILDVTLGDDFKNRPLEDLPKAHPLYSLLSLKHQKLDFIELSIKKPTIPLPDYLVTRYLEGSKRGRSKFFEDNQVMDAPASSSAGPSFTS